MVRYLSSLIVFCLVLSGCQDSADSWQHIEAAGLIKVGLDPSYPPFEQLVDGQVSGIDVALMDAVAEELGLQVHVDVIGYDGLYDALLTGRVDVLASALIIDETRSEQFAYSVPYFNAGQVLVVEAGSGLVSAETAPSVAVELGAAGHVVMAEAVRKGSAQAIVLFDSAETALDAVRTGDVPAAIVDHVSARLSIAQHPSLHIADEAVTVEPYALVVRAEDSRLLAQLDEALDRLIASGKLDQLIEKQLNP